MPALPRLLITLGDVAGIGPEVLLDLWAQSSMFTQCQPVVVGDVAWLKRLAAVVGCAVQIQPVEQTGTWPRATGTVIPCIQGTMVELKDVEPGRPQTAAGRASFDFLKLAIDMTLAGQADGIVTLPLHKEALHLAGLHYPGHTEILAEACGVKNFAMMLYAPLPRTAGDSQTNKRYGVGVAHVTLHQSLRSVFADITQVGIEEKIVLTHDIMKKLIGKTPRIGVCALNPHAGDGGIFGNEEATIIQPAVEKIRRQGIEVTGPWPSDTLFRRAQSGEFDGIVAMYHDQGHIALKLMCGFHLVNITLGLPIVRTSVAHGTAYDIVGKKLADPYSLQAAIDVACGLIAVR